jgi:hypothetical protein
MIGQVALTKKKGELFLITDRDDAAGHVDGIMLTQAEFSMPVRETEPRVLCDLKDVLSYQKVGDEVLKLIRRESEETESLKDTKSLESIDDTGPFTDENETVG